MKLITSFILLLLSYSTFGLESEPKVDFSKEAERKHELPKDAQGNDYPLTWGEFDPGKGMLLGRNELGDMHLSFYVLGRYINQQPANSNATDHLNRTTPVDTRNDIELHRILVWLKGRAYDPKLYYNINFWTVNSTKGIHTVGSLAYRFSEKFNFLVGVEGLPGIRSFNGQHPYFLGTDRHLGDEFFKPGFTMGASVFGQFSKNVFYRAMVGNQLSEIGIATSQMDRNMAYGGTIWYLSTGEFGPRGGYGDYELHSERAYRVGLSAVQSREDGMAQPNDDNEPKNTSIRLSDGLNLFSPNALAEGATVNRATYTSLSADAAMKYRGFFFDINYYWRKLDGFKSTGTKLPMNNIKDNGFQIQMSHQVKPQKLELYTSYTYIWGEFNNPWEIAIGGNYYPRATRNWRLNMVLNHVEQSPVNSQFGYYVGGQTGETIILASDVFF